LQFHFNLNHGHDVISDDEGSELCDLDAAKHEARQIIRDLAAHRLRECVPFTLRSVLIGDAEGTKLAEVTTMEALEEVFDLEDLIRHRIGDRQTGSCTANIRRAPSACWPTAERLASVAVGTTDVATALPLISTSPSSATFQTTPDNPSTRPASAGFFLRPVRFEYSNGKRYSLTLSLVVRRQPTNKVSTTLLQGLRCRLWAKAECLGHDQTKMPKPGEPGDRLLQPISQCYDNVGFLAQPSAPASVCDVSR
jgi:hypothetical protein